ncbi:hypothetical protein [Adhaeribacter rhizoryzae]|uniref:TonB C-terminal domain-containing protein n=1 Tax=Adhaeribacter rhizoryzae TaxID=2607907 RepID=A0A5M6DDP8_9BACT|nr:hypothetical protein [Adhaeribacter rhizoryzae]KAA5544229.1 hypothetical protein F0145_15085 [Adhaeribacter rhizoryzae]
MLKIILKTLFILLLALPAYSQAVDTLNTPAKPRDGLTQLALAYYKIKFTKEQRKQLVGVELEFIYSVTPDGTPTLEEVHGTNEPAIIDSLKRITSLLPKFQPKRENGINESDLLFMKLQFPRYRVAAEPLHNYNFGYKAFTLNDLEYIHKSGSRIDGLIGVLGNGFAGNAGKHLGLGGGMKMDMLYTGKNGFGGGMTMSFYGNKLKEPYPLQVTRAQNNAPPTLFLGIIASKLLSQKEQSNFNLQLELNYAIQNVTPKESENDKDWVQLQGFSPGLVANYALKIGKDKLYYYYGSPMLYSNYFNLNGGIRPIFFNLKEASGLMLEFGISFRMGMHGVTEYKLKPEALVPGK